MAKKKVTINDVAKHCHLSIATVSRIVNNLDYPISEKTRKKVMAAVEELQYTPNVLGRYLKQNQTNEVGVIVPHISNYYYSEIVAGINDSLLHSGYSVLLCDSYRNPRFEKKQILSLLQKKVKGIILSPSSSELEWERSLIPENVAFVTVDQPVHMPSHSVSTHHEEGGRIAARYLLEKGHTKIAFASAPLTARKYRQQMDGFLLELKAHGIEPDPAYIRMSDSDRISENTYEFDIGVRLANSLSRLAEPPTAVVCVSDTMATGMIRGLKIRGLRVPEDIAVVGFGNLAVADMVTPALTTVDQCMRNIGTKAVEILMKEFDMPGLPIESILYEPQLIKRESA